MIGFGGSSFLRPEPLLSSFLGVTWTAKVGKIMALSVLKGAQKAMISHTFWGQGRASALAAGLRRRTESIGDSVGKRSSMPVPGKFHHFT